MRDVELEKEFRQRLVRLSEEMDFYTKMLSPEERERFRDELADTFVVAGVIGVLHEVMDMPVAVKKVYTEAQLGITRAMRQWLERRSDADR